MAKFFISYSHSDKTFALQLRENIAKIDNAHDVFIDQYGLHVGSKIKTALIKKIEWCDYFIIILSQNSIKSKWVQFELNEARRSEIKCGEKKLFAVHLDHSELPKHLVDYLVLDFTVPGNFTANFFRLMNGIYQKPTHYEIEYSVKNDTDTGYLFNMWVSCPLDFLHQIELVEYRFDYEFDLEAGSYNLKKIDGPVHIEKSAKRKFGVYDLWTSESITVFVCIYLKNTRAVYFRKYIEVGRHVN
ncbi:MAG: toll/interleukin-1 receptor domain-containing protein [Chitinophagaceae bacterium]|nr:toll/interleukin-1 receptor domain-containing protein [Chitinophagaceae bacterium]